MQVSIKLGQDSQQEEEGCTDLHTCTPGTCASADFLSRSARKPSLWVKCRSDASFVLCAARRRCRHPVTGTAGAGG